MLQQYCPNERSQQSDKAWTLEETLDQTNVYLFLCNVVVACDNSWYVGIGGDSDIFEEADRVEYDRIGPSQLHQQEHWQKVAVWVWGHTMKTNTGPKQKNGFQGGGGEQQTN